MKGALARIPLALSLRTTQSSYQQVAAHDLGEDGTNLPTTPKPAPPPPASRWKRHLRRCSGRRFVGLLLLLILLLALAGRFQNWQDIRQDPETQDNGPDYPWLKFPRADAGFFNGIRSLTKLSEWRPAQGADANTNITIHAEVPFDPVRVDPFGPAAAGEYPIERCFLDEQEQVPAPDIFAYPGVPANASAPSWGAYESIHVAADRCYERFGRFGPYGYSYGREAGGLGLAEQSERAGAEQVLARFPPVDYRNVSWGQAQKRCFARNRHRFDAAAPAPAGGAGRAAGAPAPPKPRTAFVLRTYTGYQYTDLQLLSLRALVNELALQSGGEYAVHLLLHVKDESVPIYASDEVYRATIEAHVPREFWDMTTLWSEALMRLYYPGPFPAERNFENPSNQPLHGVYRSAHLALQWFAQQHPEYDHFWNWEMDVRYAGHHYEFHEGVARWAAQQPRKLLWERSARFWIPARHGSWADFAAHVEREAAAAGEAPVWGPVEFARGDEGALPPLAGTAPPTGFAEDAYAWGVGEAADLIVFDPLFDPARTHWVFRLDADGYDPALPPPPRRTAIITIARLSRRLLDRMHAETYRLRHSMFPEMWPPSVALHAGLKAVYAPHPVVFDHAWPPDAMDQVFNHPRSPAESPFAWGEHNMRGGSFYYDSGFSSVLWRRWLGGDVDGHGGRAFEESHGGRMCMRPLLHHPVKADA